MKQKIKKCKCGQEYTQYTTMQNLCTACLILKGRKIAARNAKTALKTQKQELNEQRERIKSRADHIKDAQFAVNAYIRQRDKGKPCISCGRPTKAGDHAGHWKPTSTSPSLRYTETNIHLQCVQCNLHLHGNVAAYRAGLIARIGQAEVELLEAPQDTAKWAIEDLKQIKLFYRLKLKDLQNT